MRRAIRWTTRWATLLTGWSLVLGLAAWTPPEAAGAGTYPCTEAGVIAAAAAGGLVSCAGPTTVVTSASISVSSTVTIDGGGTLTLNGGNAHRLFDVLPGASLTLKNMTLERGHAQDPSPTAGQSATLARWSWTTSMSPGTPPPASVAASTTWPRAGPAPSRC